MKKIFKVVGLFSGVGGLELGFLRNKNYQISWANEFDKYCARTYRANFNHKFIEKDINELSGKNLSDVDVLVGGFPCQAFSVAGYQKGFEDQRGNVFFQIIKNNKWIKTKTKSTSVRKCQKYLYSW